MEEKDKPNFLCIKRWVAWAILAMSSMGTGQYLFATKFSQEGIIATSYVGPVPFLFCIFLKVYLAIRTKIKTGSFIDFTNSNIFDKDGKI